MERESRIDIYLPVAEARQRLFAWREAGGEQNGGLEMKIMARGLYDLLRPLWDAHLPPHLDDALTEVVAVLWDIEWALTADVPELTRLCRELEPRLDSFRQLLVEAQAAQASVQPKVE